MYSGGLILHYDAGCRGDFLAAILNNTLSETGPDTKINPKVYYRKIHNAEDYDFLDSPDLKIRIALPKSIDGLIQVSFLHHLKNRNFLDTDAQGMSTPERHYYFLRYIYNNEIKTKIHESRYNYWINFEDLFDIEYIKNLYYAINKQSLSPQMIKCIKDNIENQIRWQDSDQASLLERLKTLIKFEIFHGVFSLNDVAPFTVDAFVQHAVPEELLDISRYFKEQ